MDPYKEEPTRVSIFVSKDIKTETDLARLIHQFIVALWHEVERLGVDPRRVILLIVAETFELIDYIFPEKKKFKYFMNKTVDNWFEAKKEMEEGN